MDVSNDLAAIDYDHTAPLNDPKCSAEPEKLVQLSALISHERVRQLEKFPRPGSGAG